MFPDIGQWEKRENNTSVTVSYPSACLHKSKATKEFQPAFQTVAHQGKKEIGINYSQWWRILYRLTLPALMEGHCSELCIICNTICIVSELV